LDIETSEDGRKVGGGFENQYRLRSAFEDERNLSTELATAVQMGMGLAAPLKICRG
jgi:hypothetical protein